MEASESIIVTLTAEAGQKWDETKKTGAIGNYSPGTGRRSSLHMVFMPDGVAPGQKVRLRLHEIKEDRAGRMMYRGTPATVQYTERWKDNGDGTASKVTISSSWKLEESEEGVVETRPLATREQSPTIRQDLKVIWNKDSDQASSFIEKVEIKSYRQETEKVREGEIVWAGTGQIREEQVPPERLPVLEVRIAGGAFDLTQVVYVDNWEVEAACQYGGREPFRFLTRYGKLPAWVRQLTEARYPVCGSCGKARYDQEKGGSWCATCRPYREAEKLIADLITPSRKEELAGEAARLIGATTVLEGDSGVVLLKATLDHIGDSWRRDDFVRRWTGYGWYYFTDAGVYGSKFSPAALQILQLLPHASGDGLVEMVAWLLGSHQKQSSPDYYGATQVGGIKTALPQLAGVIQQLVAGSVGCAVRLRGSEQDRQATLAEYHRLTIGSDGDTERARSVGSVASILQEEKQDYAAALTAIREAEAKLAQRKPASKPKPAEPEPFASSGEPSAGFNNPFTSLAGLMKEKK